MMQFTYLYSAIIISYIALLCNLFAGSSSPVRNATYVAIEVKRKAGIDAVDQVLRYMDALKHDDRIRGDVRGIVVALTVARNAKVYAARLGVKTVEVDYDQLRGIDPDELRLF